MQKHKKSPPISQLESRCQWLWGLHTKCKGIMFFRTLLWWTVPRIPFCDLLVKAHVNLSQAETVKYSFWPTYQSRGTLHGGVYWTICALFILDQMKVDKCGCSSRQLAFPNTPFSRQVPFSPIWISLMKFHRNCFGIIVCPEYVYVSVIFASNKDKVSLMRYSDGFQTRQEIAWRLFLCNRCLVEKVYLSSNCLSSGQGCLGSCKCGWRRRGRTMWRFQQPGEAGGQRKVDASLHEWKKQCLW